MLKFINNNDAIKCICLHTHERVVNISKNNVYMSGLKGATHVAHECAHKCAQCLA